MTRIILQAFDGEIPRMEGHYLPENNATEAKNCKLTNGAIRPMRGGEQELGGLVGVAGIVKFAGQWHTFPNRIDAVPGPTNSDRLYLTQQGSEPQIYADGAWSNLHFANPTVRPSRTVSGDPAAENAESVRYGYTLVSSLGEETGPSPLSFGVLFSEGRTVHLSGMPTATTMNNRTITNKRIYRSQTSAAGVTDLYFIAEIPQSQGTFDDLYGDNDIQEPCPTKNYAPVDHFLRGLTGMANGIMAGYWGRTVHFCEPYQPHMWPREYQIRLDYNIRALVATGTSLVVLTEGEPYIVQGLHPESMASQKVESVYPCVHERSAVDMGYSAIYASTDGLVEINEGGAQIISKHLFSKDDWASLQPHTMRAGRWGNAYVFTFNPISGPREVYAISLDGEQPALSRVALDVDLFYNDPSTNDLYYIPVSQDSIQKFDAGTALSYIWKSKLYRFADPISFSAFLLDLSGDGTAFENTLMHIEWQDVHLGVLDNASWTAETTNDLSLDVNDPPAVISNETTYTATLDIDEQAAGNYTIKFYADGNLIHQVSTGANEVMRIPDGEYRQWQIAIEGTAEVVRLTMGQSATEVWT